MENNKIKIIACSIFKYEIEEISKVLGNHFTIELFDSYLHLFPSELSHQLNEKLEKSIYNFKNIVLLCGDCHPFMKEMTERPYISKIKGCNCVEILIGRELRRKYLKQGAFFLLPEWTIRWREIFKELLELPQTEIKSILHEHHKKFIYLDTGILPVPYKEIEECASFFDLPFEIEKISMDYFINAIQSEIEKINQKK